MTVRAYSCCFLLIFACTCCAAQVAARYDVIIDELLADPSPSVGLPGEEFIELKNRSAHAFDLNGWKIGNHSSATVIKRSFVLQPGSVVILCAASAEAAYAPYGETLGLPGFPTLGNDGDTISLESPEGSIIHAVKYSKSWYNNEVKSEGGWTLEMIDLNYPCGGSINWTASTDPHGGSPGRKNAVSGTVEGQPPALLRTYTADSITLVAVFDEPIDSNSGGATSNYLLDQGIGMPASAFERSPLFNEVILKLPAALHPKTVYQLTVHDISDCAGHSGSTQNNAKTGLADPADSFDIVINEILFNPKSNGYDYVEIYNRSNKVIDLHEMFVANRDASGGFNPPKEISAGPYLFFPGEFIVITENGEWLRQNYIVKNPDKIIELSGLPSLPDDEGDIALLNRDGDRIDELHYSHTWHMPLISDETGVSLERQNYNQPTQLRDNWTSAAATAGFGTPTYQNSEFNTSNPVAAGITVSPAIFSPDNDGFNDYCFIYYEVKLPGYIGTLTIYDATGRPVRALANNATLSVNGSFRWDGLDDRQQKLPVGIYIIVGLIYDLQGRTQQFKREVILAGKRS